MPLPYIGPAPGSATDVATKGYADSVGGGGSTVTTVYADLDIYGKATIFDATVTSTSQIILTPCASVDTDVNDIEMDPAIVFVGSISEGSFVAHVEPLDIKHIVTGPFKMMYTVYNTLTNITQPGTVTLTAGSMFDGSAGLTLSVVGTGGQLSRWAIEYRKNPSTTWLNATEVVATGTPQSIDLITNTVSPGDASVWEFRARARNSSGYSATYSNTVSMTDNSGGG